MNITHRIGLLAILLAGCETVPQPTVISFTPLNGDGTCLIDATAYRKARNAQVKLAAGWGRILGIEWVAGGRDVAGHAVYCFEEGGALFAYTGKFQQLTSGGSVHLGTPESATSMTFMQSNPDFLATRFMGARSLFARAYFLPEQTKTTNEK